MSKTQPSADDYRKRAAAIGKRLGSILVAVSSYLVSEAGLRPSRLPIAAARLR